MPFKDDHSFLGDMMTNEEKMDALLQVGESMQSLQEITSRVDERVRALLLRQTDFDEKIHEIRTIMTDIVSRVAVLESRNDNDLHALVHSNRDRLFEIEKQIHIWSIKESGKETKWKHISIILW